MQLYENKPVPNSARFYANRPSVRFHPALSIPEQRNAPSRMFAWMTSEDYGEEWRAKNNEIIEDLPVDTPSRHVLD